MEKRGAIEPGETPDLARTKQASRTPHQGRDAERERLDRQDLTGRVNDTTKPPAR